MPIRDKINGWAKPVILAFCLTCFAGIITYVHSTDIKKIDDCSSQSESALSKANNNQSDIRTIKEVFNVKFDGISNRLDKLETAMQDQNTISKKILDAIENVR